MSILNINFFVISICILLLWIFLINKIYLKFYEVRLVKKRINDRLLYNKEMEASLISKQFPDYIIRDIMQSEDKEELITLYVFSKDLIDYKVFNDVDLYFYRGVRSICYDVITGKNDRRFNFFIAVTRLAAIFGLIFFTYLFVNNLFVPAKIGSSDIQFLYWSIFILIILMPNRVFGKTLFANKFYALSAYVSSILISLTFLFYMSVNDLYIKYFLMQNLLAMLIILIGVYSYIGYEKFEAMIRFFELLRSNKKINKIN